LLRARNLVLSQDLYSQSQLDIGFALLASQLSVEEHVRDDEFSSQGKDLSDQLASLEVD
jgi:hypothetical protein